MVVCGTDDSESSFSITENWRVSVDAWDDDKTLTRSMYFTFASSAAVIHSRTIWTRFSVGLVKGEGDYGRGRVDVGRLDWRA